MSLALDGAARLAHARTATLAGRPWALALIGVALTLALQAPILVAVWSSGRFFDTDDAMRLVELRDWLGGQAFSDLTQRRLNPDDPVAMHWSRVLDLPLAALRLGFGLFAGPDMAERLMRIALPLALLFAFFAAVAGLARRLGASPLAAVLLAFAGWATMAQFAPGRIDHHSAQILLLVLMTTAACDALAPAQAGRAAIAGALAMLSLAISVENLPFIAALAGGLCIAWILGGRRDGAALKAFAIGLAGASIVARVFIPSSTPDAGACDALSRFHLFAALGGAALFATLAILARPVASRTGRFACAAVGAVLLAGALDLAFPACFRDPLAAVDPMLKDIWLSQVSEARSLGFLLARRPDMALPLGAPILLALAVALAAARRSVPASRAYPDLLAARTGRNRWLLMALLIGAGLVVALWQVRAATSTLPFVAIAGAWVVRRLGRPAEGEGSSLRLLPGLAALPFAGLFWMSILPAPSVATGAPGAAADACFEPRAYSGLAALPPGLVLSSLDAGSYILAHTSHAALAGAYHRNNSGNRRAVEAFLAPPEAAEALVRASGADYVAICPAMQDVEIYADRAPGGLAAALRAGRVPAWLAPVSAAGAYRIYRLR